MSKTNDFEKFKTEALNLAGRANHFTYGDGGDPAVGHALAAEAQVYATLALAEATRANRVVTVREDRP